MTDKIRVTLTRPVQHDGVDYAPGESLEMGPDMAAALIACGAAVEAPAREDEAPDAESPKPRGKKAAA